MDYTFRFLFDIVPFTILSLLAVIDNLRVSVALGTVKDVLPYQNKIALSFGVSESLALLIGFLIGKTTATQLEPWVSFLAPLVIGGIGLLTLFPFIFKKKIRINYKWLLISLPFSLSFDNLAVGVVIGITGINILFFVIIVGITAFFTAIVGIKLGNIIHNRLNNRSELISGIIFIFVAISFLFTME
jgi:putative Mn2+ efflux pump MntP